MLAGIVGGGNEYTVLSSTFNAVTEVRSLSKALNPHDRCVFNLCVCSVLTAVFPSMGHHTWPRHVLYNMLFLWSFIYYLFYNFP